MAASAVPMALPDSSKTNSTQHGFDVTVCALIFVTISLL